jgi:hypothetical protein
MAEDNKDNINANTDQGIPDLTKTLDDAMAAADVIMAKSKENDSFLKALSSPENRKKAMEYMKKNHKEDVEEDEEEDENEENIKKPMKKTEEAVNPEVIDANPILGKFVNVLKSLESKIDSFEKKIENIETMQKSFGDVSIASANLLKTMNVDIVKAGNVPLPVKGKTEILKTNTGEDIPKSVIADTLLKCAQTGKITSIDLARCEMERFDINYLSKTGREVLITELKKGGLI